MSCSYYYLSGLMSIKIHREASVARVANQMANWNTVFTWVELMLRGRSNPVARMRVPKRTATIAAVDLVLLTKAFGSHFLVLLASFACLSCSFKCGKDSQSISTISFSYFSLWCFIRRHFSWCGIPLPRPLALLQYEEQRGPMSRAYTVYLYLDRHYIHHFADVIFYNAMVAILMGTIDLSKQLNPPTSTHSSVLKIVFFNPN